MQHETSILVTGGSGFIGSNFVRHVLAKRPDWRVVNLDALTYAGSPDNLRDIEHDDRYTFLHGDVREAGQVAAALDGCGYVVHLAAESHVDRSIADGAPFASTNVVGTQVLLDVCRHAGNVERIVHVSTDEVYGSLPLDEPERRFTEVSPLEPSSPYAASKAAADLLALAHHTTYDTPVCITRCSNNLGPYQYPEKVIPLFVTSLLAGEPVPLYGDGRNVRDWIHVEDHCAALLRVLEAGTPGTVYNVGADNEQSNLDLTRGILEIMGQPETMIRHVTDRLGHDRRYAVDATRLRTELGWAPTRSDWPDALVETVEWYREHHEWCEKRSSRRAA